MKYREMFQGEVATSYSSLFEVNSTEGQLAKIEKELCLEILKEEKLIENFTHLDFACGTGRILGYFETISREQFGFDISPDMLNIAKDFSKAKLLLPSEYYKVFDTLKTSDVVVITAFRFLLNAPSRDLEDFLLFCKKILDSQERVYLMVNNHGNKFSFRSLTLGILLRKGNKMSERELRRKLAPLNFIIYKKISIQLVPTGILSRLPWLFQIEKKVSNRQKFNFGINQIFFGKISK